MHKTLKADTLQPPAATLRQQQRRFDAFQKLYNEQRPHQALEHQPPARVYAPSPRPYPTRITAPEYASDWQVREVYTKGSFYFDGHHYFLSDALGDTQIALAATEHDHCLAVYYHHVIIAYVDLRRKKITTALPKVKK